MSISTRDQRRAARAKRKQNQRIALAGILFLFVLVILVFNWRKIFSSGGDMITTASGLQYEDIVVGSGQEAKPGDLVSVHYTGWLEDGTKFDSSLDRNEAFEFQLGVGGVIEGWDEGVAGMRVGGTRKLTNPAHLGYGEWGAGGVTPPNATLIFEVQLLAIR